MKRYEYIRLKVDMGDLSELNSLASVGWHVVAMYSVYALLERELPPSGRGIEMNARDALKQWEKDTGLPATTSEGSAFMDGFNAGRQAGNESCEYCNSGSRPIGHLYHFLDSGRETCKQCVCVDCSANRAGGE